LARATRGDEDSWDGQVGEEDEGEPMPTTLAEAAAWFATQREQ